MENNLFGLLLTYLSQRIDAYEHQFAGPINAWQRANPKIRNTALLIFFFVCLLIIYLSWKQ